MTSQIQPTISFVHGFMGDPSDWDWVSAELSGYDTVAPLIQPAEDWNAGVEQLIEQLPPR